MLPEAINRLWYASSCLVIERRAYASPRMCGPRWSLMEHLQLPVLPFNRICGGAT